MNRWASKSKNERARICQWVLIAAFVFSVIPRPAFAGKWCEPLSEGHNKEDPTQINLLFAGFGYEDKKTFLSLITHVVDLEGKGGGLFSLEPYKSNAHLFNLWYIVSQTKTESRAQMTAEREVYTERGCRDARDLKNFFVLTYSNKPPFPGMPHAAASFGEGATILWQEGHTSEQTLTSQRYFLIHEFGAHGFAELVDEYTLSSATSVEARTRASAAINCFVGTYAACLKQAPWKDMIGQGCGDPRTVDCGSRDPLADKEVGCFEGCRLLKAGAFRPHRSTVLNTSKPLFGLFHEREICKKIQEYTDRATGYCYNTFTIGAPRADAPSPKIEAADETAPPRKKFQKIKLLLPAGGALLLLVYLRMRRHSL